jgi:hypothetical protein
MGWRELSTPGALTSGLAVLDEKSTSSESCNLAHVHM